jgi:hypothetical protein
MGDFPSAKWGRLKYANIALADTIHARTETLKDISEPVAFTDARFK